MSEKTIYGIETSGQEFDFYNTLNPIGIFNQLMRDCRIREEQERQAKLIEARKKYVYGFKEVEFDELFGKNVFSLDHGYDCICYGYLTFKDKVISDYPIQLGRNIQSFLDKLNEDYNEGKKYRVQEILQVFSVNDDKKKSYVCEKCIENKKKKYVDGIEHILDIQAGEFVYNVGKRSGIGTPYIYDNIIHFDHKYVHIPTGKTVIDTSSMKHDVNATEIRDYSTINVDKYIIFSATKFNGSLHNRYDVAVKLNKITGEVTEIE
jgi:hypothetical protein